MLRRKDGSTFVAELSMQMSAHEHAPMLVAIANDISERLASEAARRQSEAHLRTITANTPALIGHFDTEGRVKFVNHTFETFYRAAATDVVGKTLGEALPTGDFAAVAAPLQRALRGETVDFEVANAAGRGRHIQARLVPEWHDGEVRGVFGLGLDITERVRAERALVEEKERERATLLSIGDAVVSIDRACRVEILNPVAERMTGWCTAEATGERVENVLHLIDQRTREPIAHPLFRALSHGEAGTLPPTTLLVSRDGREYPVEDSANPIHDYEGNIVGAVLVFRDVTASRDMLSRMEYQVRHDALTGLLSRNEFERVAKALVEATQENGHEHALLYIDLDQFKVVNDSQGHQAGDELLRELSRVLQGRLRKSDRLSRLGGDEFGALLLDCPLAQAVEIAQGLVSGVADFRFHWQTAVFRVGASIGVVTITKDSKDVKDLLIAADTACYMAKDKGRGRVQVFRPDDAEVHGRRVDTDWVSRLTDALEHDRFCLYGQRIEPIGSGAGPAPRCEVLVRLIEADGTVVPPMAFLPAAERYNLIRRLDRWVIRTALVHVAQVRPSTRVAGALYSINLSGSSLGDETLLAFIIEELERLAVPPEAICFEITETAAVSNLAKALELIRRLRDRGCRFALDDFGSGLSSFSYLTAFPIDYLKIDGGLVRDIAVNPVHSAIVEAIHNIGHTMNIKTVAEFVENADVLHKLRTIGVDYAQGYLIHRPEPLTHVIAASSRASLN